MRQGRKEFKEHVYKDIQLEKASPESLGCVHSMAHAIIEGSDPENVEFRPQNVTDKDIKRVCLNIVQSNSNIASGSESTFVDKYLMPYIRNIFLTNSPENIIYSLAEGRQIQTRTKPDVMVGLKLNKKEVYIFFIEAKRPETSSKYQEEDDYVKLMKHLKESINSQISLGMHKPQAFGVLCEGFKCSFYSMTLVEEGVYLPVHVSSFRLAESELSLMDVTMVVESLEVAKSYISCFEEAYASRTTKNKTTKRFKTESFKTKFGKSGNKEE